MLIYLDEKRGQTLNNVRICADCIHSLRITRLKGESGFFCKAGDGNSISGINPITGEITYTETTRFGDNLEYRNTLNKYPKCGIRNLEGHCKDFSPKNDDPETQEQAVERLETEVAVLSMRNARLEKLLIKNKLQMKKTL